MRYRNIKTGIEFTSSCVISGDDYEEIKPKATAPEVEPKVEPVIEAKAPEKKATKTIKKVEPVKRAKK